MSFLDVMSTYFRGEKIEALAFILPIGLLLVIFGGVVLKSERTGFTWGAAIPAIVFGLVFTAIGISVGARASGQVEALRQGFEQAPATMVQAELPRIQKINHTFRMTIITFGVLVAIGMVLLYAVRTEWAQGLGSVLILISALGLMIDGFASRRAVPYTAALEQVAAQHPLRE